jgi:hypothetical protein
VTEKYQRKPNTRCFVCDKAIYKRPGEIKENKGRVFCTMACFGISCRKESPCVICGKPILAGLHRKTCGRSCANKHRAGIQYKINAPRDIVKSQQALKVKLIETRGKKCERCSYDKYQILQVHHKDRDRKNSKLENLELICPNCHFEEHYLEKNWPKDRLEKNLKKDILV